MDTKERFVINVGRQLGSGGRIIGSQLARELSFKFYDKELIELAAQESGFSKKFFERNDENRGWARVLFNYLVPFSSSGDPFENQLSEESLFKFQSDAIQKAAQEDSCVFVGRCADYILREHPRCLNVFISAEKEDRIKRVMQTDSISATEAERLIEKVDEQRASYYNYYSTKTWGNASTYHLCINSSVLGTEETTSYIRDFARKRFKL